jgi:exosortase
VNLPTTFANRRAVIVLQLIALLPVLNWFGKRLNDGNDEALGLLTLSLALILAWRERKSLGSDSQSRLVGAGLLVLSVLTLPWLPPMIRAILAVIGIACTYGVHRRAGLLGLLLLSLPVAASMQFFTGYPLRVAAAEGAVRLLELFSVVVSRTGTQIELGGRVVGVDPACSGVRLLWHTLAAAMALAAIHRLSWRATCIGGLLAIALVIPANIVRATLLVVQETGHLPEALVNHTGIGLISFSCVLVPLWAAISSRARIAEAPRDFIQPGNVEGWLLVAAAFLTPVIGFGESRSPRPPSFQTGPEVFAFNDLVLPLHPLPATEAELAFAKSFPGSLSSHRWGNEQVILRQVHEATRRLHPSSECLRAAGFKTSEAFTVDLSDGTRWSRFYAERDGLRLIVHERITSPLNQKSWTDVSSWYWFALWHPLNGPWQAETLISR